MAESRWKNMRSDIVTPVPVKAFVTAGKKWGFLTGSVSATAFSVDLHLRMNYNMKDYIGII